MAGLVSCNLFTVFIVAGKSHNTLEETSYFEDSSLFIEIFEKLNEAQTEKCKPHSSLSTNHFTREIYTIHIMNSLAV